jgi:hypothetical protein
MKALFIGALATGLVACTSFPAPEINAARKPVASKAGSKIGKSIKPKKTKSAAKLGRLTTATLSPADQSKGADPITEKAKAAISALLEEPASAEFYDLKRAKKKLPHRTVDTVCGYVKATDGPGGEPRRMPFLFTVDDGEAYLVNGTSHVAQTVYNHLCK